MLGRELVDTMTADATAASGVVGPAILKEHWVHNGRGDITRAELQDGAGQVLSAVDLTYDGLGRVVHEAVAARSHDVTRSYSLGLGLTTLGVDGRTFTHTRDLSGRLTAIVDENQKTLVQFDFAPGSAAGPRAIAYGNGVGETRTFDVRGRIAGQQATTGFALAYGYGVDGTTRQVGSTLQGNGTLSSLLVETDPVGRVTNELWGVTATGLPASGAIDNAAVERFLPVAQTVRAYTLDTDDNWT